MHASGADAPSQSNQKSDYAFHRLIFKISAVKKSF
jgi:hypothetical protein